MLASLGSSVFLNAMVEGLMNHPCSPLSIFNSKYYRPCSFGAKAASNHANISFRQVLRNKLSN